MAQACSQPAGQSHSPLPQPSRCFAGVVAEDQISAGPLEAQQGFEGHGPFINPAGFGWGRSLYLMPVLLVWRDPTTLTCSLRF